MVQIARSFSILTALLLTSTAVALPHNLVKRQDQTVGQPQGTQGQGQGQGQNGQTGAPPPTGTLTGTGTLPPPTGTRTGTVRTNVQTNAPANTNGAAQNGANGSHRAKRQDSVTFSFTDTAFPTDLPSGSVLSDLPAPSGSGNPSGAPAPDFSGASGSVPPFASGSDLSAFPQPSGIQAAPSDIPSGSGFSDLPVPSGSVSDPPPTLSGTPSDVPVVSVTASA